MSRARNIKPGFFSNDVLVELPFEYRLLFIGLWTEADRAGRLEDRPLKIKMMVFPADNVDVNAGLQALHDRGFIQRYDPGLSTCAAVVGAGIVIGLISGFIPARQAANMNITTAMRRME